MSHTDTLSVDQADLRSVLGHFPSGVVVVTGMTEAGSVGLTVQSFMALSMDPPLVLLSIARTSKSWPVIKATGLIGINILSESHAELALAFARSGGPKFDSCNWRPGPATGSPLIADAIAWIEAEIWQVYDGGDHEIVAARIVELSALGAGCQPLLFFQSKFARLAGGSGVAE
jgi:3-hydroxy-9,10-secoandrosta-1,3,5(10)-triene-9,17-dione monooxygenase reductase component